MRAPPSGGVMVPKLVLSGRHSCLLFWQENSTFNALPYLASLQLADVVEGKALPRGQTGCPACHPTPPHPTP